jgi:hypothetical protein
MPRKSSSVGYFVFLGKQHFRIDECTRAERCDQQEKQGLSIRDVVRTQLAEATK